MAVKQLIKHLTPTPILRTYQNMRASPYAAQRLWDDGEPEARLLPALCDPTRAAVDVGANVGAYSWHMRRYARLCHMFEPNPDLAAKLAIGFALRGGVRLHRVALSDQPGTAVLRLPHLGAEELIGLATIDTGNTLAGLAVREIPVPLRRLDDIKLGDVGFMKIDVEGHELAVLRGATALLRASRPNLLIEAQERHRPNAVHGLAAFLAPFGYSGCFLHDGALHDIATFDPAIHQHPDSLDGLSNLRPDHFHVANFIFGVDMAALRPRLEQLLEATLPPSH